MEKQFAAWLPWDCGEACSPADAAMAELKAGMAWLKREEALSLHKEETMGEGYRITWVPGEKLELTGGETGLMYGAFAAVMALAEGKRPPEASSPRYALRMLNCWDNPAGDVERGYAGRSLFFENNRLDYDPERMRVLARMLASVGINVLCVNNVNVHEPGQELLGSWLPELAKLAGIFRPYGIRLMTCIDFAMPIREGLATADPLDADVQAWWRRRAELVWAAIPDFAGFLVKADSEHRPGPFTYGRGHDDGANMLARAVKPFGGVVVWRCFVYNCLQDWRDRHTDRPRAAYDTYKPLDGKFDDNVILQVKNGPYDFQVREPVSPLLVGMEHTNLALEVQLAQEYTGQQIDLYAMPPMWREVFDDMGAERVMAVAAVSNLGRDANYTGHPFAAVNLYAWGRFAWDPASDPEQVIRSWCRLTYALPALQEEALVRMLLTSRETYEKYTAPLGLGWMVSPNNHYGPNPYGYEFQAWGTYLRADRNAVGIDRTAAGTGYLLQYPERLRARYADPAACPDNLKLFFHRLPYDYSMPDGRTMIQRIYDDHFEGLERTQSMSETLDALDIPSPDREEARRRMDLQLQDAREWCDIVNTFFHRLSGAEDAHGRTIYD